MSHLFVKMVIFVTFIFFAGACGRVMDPITRSEKRQLNEQEVQLIASDNRFGIKIFKELALSAQDSNIFISPLSISLALGMTLNGAAGETRTAMEKTLELHGLTQDQINQSYLNLMTLLTQLDPNVIFKIANSIWMSDALAFEKEFIDINRHYFKARVEVLNFADPNSVSIINQWVADQTNGKIKNMIKQINLDDIMFLINAIYFKGIWTYQFDPKLTEEGQFYQPSGQVIPCKFMKQEREFLYQHDEQVQSVDLPYGEGDFRMAVMLPKAGYSINQIISQLSDEEFFQWLNRFQSRKGILELPKFKISYEKNLNDVLKSLGMAIAFSGAEADFTNLFSGPGNAFISLVKHKSFVQVDEEGTEAAAATSVTMSRTSIGNDDFYMRADRPFLFVLYDNYSKTILFLGKITEPLWANI